MSRVPFAAESWAVVAARPAALLAAAERLCPSLNGASAQRLANVVEAATAPEPLGLDLATEADLGWVRAAIDGTQPARIEFWEGELQRLEACGIVLVSAADIRYPANLRMIHNRPPFLFVNGTLSPDDDRAVAIVGTRKPSARGVEAASHLSLQLVRRGITVVSGLAEGIDAAAHEAALNAGGRTLAVFGTGIEVIFPARHRALARRIIEHGACVSQFWPNMRGARWSFPVRNVVTSGLSLGTVVVEAGETSGARLQAEEALGHGKRLFLLRDLVLAQSWARQMAERPGVEAVDSADDVMKLLEVDLTTTADVML